MSIAMGFWTIWLPRGCCGKFVGESRQQFGKQPSVWTTTFGVFRTYVRP